MSTLDKFKQDPMAGRLHGINNGRKVKAIYHVGQAVNMAVEKFMQIAETIAEDNPEIKSDMHDACKDARDAGKSIERICEIESTNVLDYPHQVESFCDYSAILIASKSLLASVTRVLLLVDIVIVKQLLTAKKKITESLDKLESVMNFTEFVRAFSMFGLEIVELAHLTGRQRNFFKEERRQAQMNSARQVLERSIPMLLTSSKTSLVHCDCSLIKENRDTVFCQIRRAIDLIHYVVKDSILTSTASNQQTMCVRTGSDKRTIYSILKQINYLMECIRPKSKSLSERRKLCLGAASNSSLLDDKDWLYGNGKYEKGYLHGEFEDYQCGGVSNNSKRIWRNTEPLPIFYAEVRDQLIHAFELLFETTHDFTDSAYTNHENRETILLLCERCKVDLNNYLGNMFCQDDCLTTTVSRRTDMDALLSTVKNLCDQLVISVADQISDLYYSLKMSADLVMSFQNYAASNDLERFQEQAMRFQDYCDHIIDVCKLLQYIAFTETLQVQAHCLAINLRIYGPQVLTAAKILWKYSTSNVANDNFEAFAEMWKWLISEITCIVKQILVSTKEIRDGRIGGAAANVGLSDFLSTDDKSALAATTGPVDLSTPGTAGISGGAIATGATGKVVSLQKADKDELSDLSENNAAGEENPYNMKWPDTTDNDILKRARNMSAMAFLMYQFTKGSGTLKTTQDLFTQAEYFAEEANRLYKVLRQFSYQVPASDNKKDLLNILDRVPTFVQTLQFTVKDHTVGKAATFVKVDHVIRETKNLMGVINTVVTKCFECANKYKLDFSSLAGGRTPGSPRGDDSSTGGMGDSKGTTNSSEGSM